MSKQAWNWLKAIVLVFAAGTIANAGYLLLQGKDMERGDWGWFVVGQVCLVVINLKILWDDYRRSRNAAEVPGLAIGKGPKKADAD